MPNSAPPIALGEGLGAGGQADGVGADHPRPVGGDVAATGRVDAEDEARRPWRRRRPAGARTAGHRCPASGCRPASSRAPSRPRTGRRRRAPVRPGGARPSAVRRKRGANWSDADQGVGRGADDVDDERQREAGEARVRGQHLRATGELEQAEGAGDDRDRAQRHQRHRDQPAGPPVRRGAVAGSRRSCRRLLGDLGDRQQREAEVAEPGQQAVQRRLVRDRAPDQRWCRRRRCSRSSRRTSSPTAGRAARGGGSRTSPSPVLLVSMSAS